MNKEVSNTLVDSELDELLYAYEPLVEPENFTQQVMASIYSFPQAIQTQPTWWQWFALTIGGIPAIMQTLGFVFSAWHVAAIN